MDGEVSADIGAGARDLCTTCLANNDFAGRNFLATEALHAKASTGVVVDIFA